MMAENDNTNLDEILATDDVYISEEQTDIEVIETVDVIEVDESEPYVIDTLDAFPALGEDNENLKHSLLNGRELADQHPITAITGLQEELNEIERLKTVYSDERNQANYYLWEDENILQEDRVGHFVSACSDINKIKICTSDNDIFGVTVDSAGFIGAQSDVARDIKYGLVVASGIVHVRCELPVNVGDYVVSNDYGYAKSNKNGYKVVGRHKIDGIEYAEIILTTPINRICELSDNVENVNERIGQAEINIVAAMNVANAAYNKSGEAVDVSEEAVKNALDALLKADGAIEDVGKIEEIVSSANQTAVEAKAIAESAAVSAETIRNEAVATANDALKDVNDLVKDLEPITTWSDPVTGNTGAEYFTTYVKDGVATKAEVQTVESLTEDNKSAIEKSAKEFSSFVSSVDKYSVGEYSQSYGLTREQAKSILKEGMIYIPTKHSDEKRSHQETFSDYGEINEFTPGCYYTWDGSDWIESQPNLVAFFSEEPNPNNILIYWYVDSNEAPEGYEPYALYIWKDEQWTKVNILDGNVTNRVVSNIRQTTNEISLEVANARGSVASLTERIEADEVTLNGVVAWKTDPDGNEYSLATIKQTANDAGASITQIVESVGANGEVNAASIVTAINGQTGDSIIKLNANVVDIEAGDISLKGQTITLDAEDGVVAIKSDKFNVDSDGNIEANGGTVGGWTITDDYLQSENKSVGLSGTNADWAFWAGYDASNGKAKFQVKSDGSLKATAGEIGGWYIWPNEIGCGSVHGGGTGIILSTQHGILVRKSTGESSGAYQDSFCADTNGNVTITGTINANYGSFSRDVTVGGRSLSNWLTEGGYVYNISATSGTVGGWEITSDKIHHQASGSINGVEFKSNILYVYSSDGAVSVGSSWHGIVGAGGEWYANHVSDKNVKNSIDTFTSEYDVLFDSLIPCRYKYNYGTSDRYHTGYIAQEVVAALESSNLTTQDFAAVIHLEKPLENGSEWMLRRDEFVALNTWQIQKAKARITELENKVAELEALIKGE